MSNCTRRPGWWYPYLFLGAFAVVVAVNLALVLLAHATFSGMSTDRPYEKGLAYNRALAAAREQQALGWSVETVIEPAAEDTGAAIAQTYRDRGGRPIDGLMVTVRLARPATAGYDREAMLDPVGSGRYQAVVPLPGHGVWEMVALARRDSVAYQTARRFILP